MYMVLSVAIAEWFALSASTMVRDGPSLGGLWNFTTSALAVGVWIELPLTWLAYYNRWQVAFRLLSTCVLVLLGPVLLALVLIGSYWDAIDYKPLCGGPGVSTT